jgi:glyoxylase-like metal-dependent hydrolase (beta-lactamase superfamily II)
MTTRRQTLAAAGLALAAPGLIGSRPASADTPMFGPARPTFYRFRLGSFEVTTLLDGAIQLDGPHPIFGENQTAEDVAAHAEANFLPAERMEISFTPVLVDTGSSLVLFDAGNPAARRPDAGNLVATLEAAGYAAEAIDTVVITHMHPDHIGGLMSEGAPAFPNAAYVTGEAEYAFWSHDDRLTGPTEGTANLVRANVVPLAERMRFISDEGEVLPGITGLAAFGHTPGHMAFHLESEGRRLLLWADAANHYVMSVQRPDWHVRFDMDKEAAILTRRRLMDMANAERIPVTGYHMPFPAVGFIEKPTPESYRWVQASYQLNL